MDQDLKQYLDQQFAQVRSEVATEIKAVRHELDKMTRDIGSEMKDGFARVEARIDKFTDWRADADQWRHLTEERLAALEGDGRKE